MRYAFVNNFNHQLAASITDSDGQMTLLSGTSDISNANPQRWYRLTLIEKDAEGVEVDREVVEVRRVLGENINIERGLEGTAARAWEEGTTVEMRVTAGVASGWVYSEPSNDLGSQAVSLQPSRTTWEEVAGAYGAVAIGYKSSALWDSTVALGLESRAFGTSSIAIGRAADAEGNSNIALGVFSSVKSANAIGIGLNAAVSPDSRYAMAIGDNSNAQGEGTLSIGHLTESAANGQVSLGARANAGTIHSAMCLTAAPVMRASLRVIEPYQHAIASRVSLPIALQGQSVNAATTGNKDAITIPANTKLLVDRLEIVVLSGAESGAAPTISIGTTPGGSDILDSHVMAGDAIHSREVVVGTPLAAAIESLHLSVGVASGTAMTIRMVAHGYLMEV